MIFQSGLISQVGASEINLEIQSSGNLCHVDEPFWIDILLINQSSDTLVFPFPAPETEKITFRGELRGRRFGYQGLSMSFIDHPVVVLPPGDTVLHTLNFWDSFLQDEDWRRDPRTGQVTLSCSYGTLESRNELSFTIEKPTGPYAAAYKLMKKYEDSLYEYPSTSLEERLRYLEQIVELYPHTGYAERAVWLLSLFGGGDASSRRQKYVTMLIEEYPSSGYVKECLPKYLFKFEKSNKDSVLRTLQSPDKPFRMRLLVSNWIKGYIFP